MRWTIVGHVVAPSLLTRKRSGALKHRSRHASSRCVKQAAKHGGRKVAVARASAESVAGADVPHAHGEPATEHHSHGCITKPADRCRASSACVAGAMPTCDADTPVQLPGSPRSHASSRPAVHKPCGTVEAAAVTFASSASVLSAYGPHAHSEPGLGSNPTPMYHETCSRLSCAACLHLALAILTCAADAAMRFTKVGHAVAQSLQNWRRGRTQPATKTRKEPARFTSCQAARPRLLQCHLPVAQTSSAHLCQRSW